MVQSIDAESIVDDSAVFLAGVSAESLAFRYDEHLAAVWRGERDLDGAFARWLESYWQAATVPEPERSPSAISRLGAAGDGIRWYAADEYVLGFAGHRADGCYRIPSTAAMPPRK